MCNCAIEGVQQSKQNTLDMLDSSRPGLQGFKNLKEPKHQVDEVLDLLLMNSPVSRRQTNIQQARSSRTPGGRFALNASRVRPTHNIR